MNQSQIKMKKPVYVSLPILEISQRLMYDFWYDYIKPNYQTNAKECYMDTESFIVYVQDKRFL